MKKQDGLHCGLLDAGTGHAQVGACSQLAVYGCNQVLWHCKNFSNGKLCIKLVCDEGGTLRPMSMVL